MDRKFEKTAASSFWWDRISSDHKQALNILFIQEPFRLRKEGIPATMDSLARITTQLANYAPGDKLVFGEMTFDDPEALARHLTRLHRGLRPGRTFSEF